MKKRFVSIILLLISVFLIIWYGANNTLNTKHLPILLNSDYEVFNNDDKKIDYMNLYLNDGKIDSPRERIFSYLDDDISKIKNGEKKYSTGKLIYTAYDGKSGAIAIFDFKENKKIYVDGFISSPLFYQPLIFSSFVDINNDGDDDIFVLSHSGNYLDIEYAWIFLYKNGKYVLVTPLSPKGVDKEKALSGEIFAQNDTKIRAHVGADGIWLRDLDGDETLELVTLDNGTFSDEDIDIVSIKKKIFKLNEDGYMLEKEEMIKANGDENKKIRNWPIVPGLTSN